MRCGLRRDIQPLALCLTYQSDALGGRNVADMVAAARLANKSEIAFYLPPFGFRADAAMSVRAGILSAVVNVSAAQQRIVSQCATISFPSDAARSIASRRYRRPAPRPSSENATTYGASSSISDSSPPASPRVIAPYGSYTDRCVALRLYPASSRRCGRLSGTGEIRHGTDGSVASVRACAAAGIYRLLVRKARLTRCTCTSTKPGKITILSLSEISSEIFSREKKQLSAERSETTCCSGAVFIPAALAV